MSSWAVVIEPRVMDAFEDVAERKTRSALLVRFTNLVSTMRQDDPCHVLDGADAFKGTRIAGDRYFRHLGRDWLVQVSVVPSCDVIENVRFEDLIHTAVPSPEIF